LLVVVLVVIFFNIAVIGPNSTIPDKHIDSNYNTVNRYVQSNRSGGNLNKMLSYRRETALQGTLVLAESGKLELRDNILLIL